MSRRDDFATKIVELGVGGWGNIGKLEDPVKSLEVKETYFMGQVVKAKAFHGTGWKVGMGKKTELLYSRD